MAGYLPVTAISRSRTPLTGPIRAHPMPIAPVTRAATLHAPIFTICTAQGRFSGAYSTLFTIFTIINGLCQKFARRSRRMVSAGLHNAFVRNEAKGRDDCAGNPYFFGRSWRRRQSCGTYVPRHVTAKMPGLLFLAVSPKGIVPLPEEWHGACQFPARTTIPSSP